MTAPLLALGPPAQIAYVVDDLESAAQWWSSTMGAGPFFAIEHIPLLDVVYRGHPSSFDHSSAYGQWGAVMVELVVDHGSGPSAVRERFAVGETGLHHMAWIVDDQAASTSALMAAGFDAVMTASTGAGVDFGFYDTSARLGCFAEIYPHHPRLDGWYEHVRAASVGWQGDEPFRVMS
jgi:catechol 2,3-dioxygenase-like lactoylglutathione lyase family enzyme